MRFVTLVDGHWHHGRPIPKGEEIESEKPLDEIFKGTFAKVPETVEVKGGGEVKAILPPKVIEIPRPSPAPASDEEEEEEEEEDAEDEKIKPEMIRSSLGKNVTASFPCTKKTGLIVLRKGSYHYVADCDNPNEALNKKGLTNTRVDDFVSQYKSE